MGQRAEVEAEEHAPLRPVQELLEAKGNCENDEQL